jgi:SAM-dependent methyltransferase
MTTPPETQPRWGDQNRDQKAHAIWQTLTHFTPPGFLAEATAYDIGCGSGEIAFHLAAHVQSMTGLDPEPWTRWQEWQQQRPNLGYRVESAMNLSLPDDCADLVICNQVYEHVPDAVRLIQEIARIVKPGGYVYFAGPNLLFPIEPHVFWPFIHWLPRPLALRLMRLAGSQAILDAYSKDYWRLTGWLKTHFTVTNAVPYILHHPAAYGRHGRVWQLLRHIPASLLHLSTWASPGFVFVLHKPSTNTHVTLPNKPKPTSL